MLSLDTNHVILGVVAVYFTLLVGIGWYFSRHAASSGDFYRGGNAIPWWAVGLSQYMAGFSAYAFVVIAGVTYSKGVFGLCWTLLAPLWIAVGAWGIARRWRRTGMTTPVEYLRERFSPGFQTTFAWLGLLARPLGNGIRMAAFGILVTALLGQERTAVGWWGIPVPDLVVIFGLLVVVAYTFLGGLYGAVVADIVQFVILQFALLPLFVLALIEVGGWSGLATAVPAGFFRLPAADSAEWLWFLGWAIIFFCDFNAGQWGLITRYLGTRSEREALKAGLLSAVLYLPLTLLAIVPILSARALFPGIHPESSFGVISRALLPGGLVALMVAAMFSATLSTISAELNSLAGVFAIDVYRQRFRPDASEAQVVAAGRWATMISGLLTLSIALLVLHGAETILAAAQQMASYFVIPMTVPLLLGLFTWRSDGRAAFAALFTGAAAAALFYFGPRWGGVTGPALTWWQNAGTAAVSVSVFLLVPRLWPPAPAAAARARALVAKLAVPQPASERPVGGFPAPLNIVGACVVITALVLFVTLLHAPTLARWPSVVATASALLLLGGGLILAERRRRTGSSPSRSP